MEDSGREATNSTDLWEATNGILFDAYRAAKEALHKALELDDSIGEARDTLGLLSWAYEWDWDAAEREFNRAIGFAGRRTEALAEIVKINEFDPGSSSAMSESETYYGMRDYVAPLDVHATGVRRQVNHEFLTVSGNATKAVKAW
jgi:hypothetical protein